MAWETVSDVLPYVGTSATALGGVWLGQWLSRRSARDQRVHDTAAADRKAELARAVALVQVAKRYEAAAGGVADILINAHAVEVKKKVNAEMRMKAQEATNAALMELTTAATEVQVLGPLWAVTSAHHLLEIPPFLTRLFMDLNEHPSTETAAKVDAAMVALEKDIDAMAVEFRAARAGEPTWEPIWRLKVPHLEPRTRTIAPPEPAVTEVRYRADDDE